MYAHEKSNLLIDNWTKQPPTITFSISNRRSDLLIFMRNSLISWTLHIFLQEFQEFIGRSRIAQILA
ncbi:unnamed protein product [Caenorhabditis angaria]|uniref:Uncharacterized protein n=1 Tax=Caenorhabditis angaria TaxID=860376 RepID=A0A9P1IM54_9PELO|nr:unnamed protein product [Caenorhabditis angaria]